MGSIVFMVIVTISIISWTVLSIVKTVVGNKAQWGKHGNMQVPPLFEKMFEKVAFERDEKIRKLEERVAVLEKIATDGHHSNRLAEEIEKLR